MITTAGLFDLQVNGFAGVDFNDAELTPAAFETAIDALLASGVTQFLPTLITATEAQLQARFKALDRATQIRTNVLELLGSKHQNNDQQNDQPMPN